MDRYGPKCIPSVLMLRLVPRIFCHVEGLNGPTVWEVLLRRTAKYFVSCCTLRVLYCAVRVLYSTIRVLYCTVHVLYCTVRVLYCTVHVLYSTVRVLYCTVRVRYSTIRVLYCTVHVLYVYCIVLYVYSAGTISELTKPFEVSSLGA